MLCGGCIQLTRYLYRKVSILSQSKRAWRFLPVTKDSNSCLSSKGSTASVIQSRDFTVHRLTSRGLVRVEGSDASILLQGLITNDMTLAEPPSSAIYAMMLNIQGRVRFDLMVYNVSTDPGSPCFMIECDSSLVSNFIKDIRKYKLRKKVDIADVSDTFSLQAILPGEDQSKPVLPVNESNCVAFTSDPRVQQFGWRLITPADINTDDIALPGSVGSEEDYHLCRYKWGISEGCTDLPPGNCFPLESNLVYLRGVSFQKGCYIGQELTARTYHTGVTRKRLMPLQLEQDLENVLAGADIRTEDDKPAGKYRNAIGHCGLGLMRLSEISKRLVIKNEAEETFYATAATPSWWPSDTDSASGKK